MTYFRNKFNEEFLFLANNISPKGGEIQLNDDDPLFFKITPMNIDGQPHHISVIPLLLYNKLSSTNSDDHNVEDYMMLCKNKLDTHVYAEYDETYITKQETSYVCDMGVNVVTGDLTEE